MKPLVILSVSTLFLIGVVSCKNLENKEEVATTYPNVQIVGAMKDAMWKGELFSRIDLDTISNTKGLYGLGPQTNLTGELLIIDGQSYVSKVESDSTMSVLQSFNTGAPFFVYANVEEWKAVEIPETINDLKALESFIDEQSKSMKRPFAFKVSGRVSHATIHIQNLPPGSKVTSPQEAHVGQTDYGLTNVPVDMVGFFSTDHQTVFTHHDIFIHIHLITKDKAKMGHLDKAILTNATLYLPVE